MYNIRIIPSLLYKSSILVLHFVSFVSLNSSISEDQCRGCDLRRGGDLFFAFGLVRGKLIQRQCWEAGWTKIWVERYVSAEESCFGRKIEVV
jgi:hypothetical protein